MPMCDAYIPEGALSASAERELLASITDLLLEHEGVDPTNERARALAWVFVHRHEMYVGGQPAQAPHYRFVCHVPEGQYNEKRRAAVTAAMTRAVVEAEAGSRPDPEGRVWVFTHEVKDGLWGVRGTVIKLPDLYEQIVGKKGRDLAEQVLAERRRQEAELVLRAAGRPASRERPRMHGPQRKRGAKA
jgi:phenylpyruvate tautomerase PptA (4-oxalocrotonate tautomerase family)